jgi:predicted phage tail protein
VAIFGVALLIGAAFVSAIPVVGTFVAGCMVKLGIEFIISGIQGAISGQMDMGEVVKSMGNTCLFRTN